jgi:DNA-binding winged helix-turn-helix (wHTH) protein/tetratricopeptide (TPR) repeat protein
VERGAFEFAAYRLDPAKRLLWREGELVALPPKAVDLLLALVEQAGEVVGKQELMDRVWPDSFVEEANLSVNVATIRKVLGSQPDGQPYVETVSRRGYRFVARAKKLGRVQIAVLPFRSLGPGSEDGPFLGMGLADALITRLASSGPVAVRSTRAVLKYADGAVDPARAGQELEVDAVLDGTVQVEGTRVCVTVQMIAVRGGAPTWADRFEAERTSLFDLQNALADRVARALELRVAGKSARRPSADFEAYQAYVKGRYFWSRFTPVEVQKAFACFEEAVARDPGFALPHAGLAEAFLAVGALGILPPAMAWARASAEAQRALELDDSLAEAHVCLGAIALFQSWDWETAGRELEHAITLNAGSAGPHQWYALYLHMRGRFKEAQHELDRARELDPLSVVVHAQLALQRYLSGDHAAELALCQKTVELEPNQFLPHWSLGMALANQGRFDEAVREHERALELAGGVGAMRAALAWSLARAGRASDARAALAAGNGTLIGGASPYQKVAALVALGEDEAALTELEKAADAHDPWVVWLKVDPMLGNLPAHPRFKAVLARVFGAPAESR